MYIISILYINFLLSFFFLFPLSFSFLFFFSPPQINSKIIKQYIIIKTTYF